MKKYISFFLSVCSVVFFLTSMIIFPVKAEKNRVVFYNREAAGSGLYITKNVIYPSDDMKLPEGRTFSFQLKVNGEYVREQSYRLFDRTGKELYNYNGSLTTEYDKSQLSLPFVTDYNGRFSLKDGETACFNVFRAGSSYEIAEEPCSDYVQMEPSGNRPAVGTLLPEGSVEVFKNKYLPELSNEKQEVMLEISKEIVFPKGLIPPESPDFCFDVTINGKPWAKEQYIIYNMNSGEKVLTGFTNEKGQFFMKGGYTARFHGIPRDSDYVISEECKKGWIALTPNILKGALNNLITPITFSNTEAAFAVSKEMTEEIITDDYFQFQLKTEGRNWAGANYYLYSISGDRVDNKTYSTDENGVFSIRADQVAVFVGIPFETQYSVSEILDRYYLQIFPPDGVGYENKTVSKSLEILSFKNQVDINAVQPVILSLLKKGEDQSRLEGAVFRISRDEKHKDEVKRVASGKDGLVKFGMIEPGVYYINEMVSPGGHYLLPNMIKIEIEKDGIRVNNTLYKYNRKYPNISFENTKEGIEVCLTIYNYKNFHLPFTGGDGIFIWILVSLTGIISLYVWAKRILDKTKEIS